LYIPREGLVLGCPATRRDAAITGRITAEAAAVVEAAAVAVAEAAGVVEVGGDLPTTWTNCRISRL
jgi:hypothetical protein